MPSATIHNRFAALATRMIDKHGRNASLVSMTETGDAWNPVQAEVLAPVVIVQTQFSAMEVDGDLVRSSDKRYLMDSSVVPTSDMRLRDGVDYSIMNVDEIKPGTLGVLYKVQARL